MIRHHKPLFSAAAGLALLSVAGCAAESADEAPAVQATNASAPAASAPASGPAAASSPAAPAPAGAAEAGAYADGEYTGTGTYIPPSGKEEEVDVQLTLEDSVVTELEVTTSGNHPTSKQYQREFTSNIKDQVVGKNIDELDVSKVLGSSLTSQGFNRALDAIRSEAAG